MMLHHLLNFRFITFLLIALMQGYGVLMADQKA